MSNKKSLSENSISNLLIHSFVNETEVDDEPEARSPTPPPDASEVDDGGVSDDSVRDKDFSINAELAKVFLCKISKQFYFSYNISFIYHCIITVIMCLFLKFYRDL